MMHFAKTQVEWESILQGHLDEAPIILGSIPTYLLVTHRITEIVVLDIGFIKEDIIPHISHQGSCLQCLVRKYMNQHMIFNNSQRKIQGEQI